MHIEDIGGFFSSFSQDSYTIVYLAGKLQDSCIKYGMILARCTTIFLQELSKVLAQGYPRTYLVLVVPPLVLLDYMCVPDNMMLLSFIKACTYLHGILLSRPVPMSS